MQPTEITRRRFVAITAAATAAGLAGSGRAHAGEALVEWRGVALGAAASIRLAHPDRAEGRRLLAACVAEIERLERLFSLYRPDSELCRLNAQGALERPSLEMVELLSRAAVVSAASGGAFDVTVQPLWQLYREHFRRADTTADGLAVAAVLPLVDWRGVSVGTERVAFARLGMAVTLNGIAQGYVTDRVAALLRAAGMTSVLIDLGEARALGGRPDGTAWQVGLAEPGTGRIAARLDLRDKALATSGGYGTVFDAAQRHSHLIDPRSGRTAPARRSVSVLAAEATVADAASTALALLPESAAPDLLRRVGAEAAYIQDAAGLRKLCA